MKLRTRPALSILPMQIAIALAASTVTAAAFAHDGWYLGLEGGANIVDDQTYKSFDDPGGTFGLGALPDGTTVSEKELKTGFLAGLIWGYATDGSLRPELELSHRGNKIKRVDVYGNTPGESNKGHGREDLDAAFGNLWLDLFKSSGLHPYLGGGAGYARFAIKNPGNENIELRDDHDGVFVWQAGGGIGFDLSPHWMLSLDYRYLRTDRATFKPVPNSDAEARSRYEAQSGLLSLRYFFGVPAPEPVPPVFEPVVVVPVIEPAPPPPPPPAPCEVPADGQPIILDGCKRGDTVVLRGVNFNFDKATLTLNAQTVLDQLTDALNKRPDIKIEIDGHTDAKGSENYNQALSQRRADSVRGYLVGKGIAGERLSTKGFGESKPVADNETDAGRELNRRVEINVTESMVGEPAAVGAEPRSTP